MNISNKIIGNIIGNKPIRTDSRSKNNETNKYYASGLLNREKKILKDILRIGGIVVKINKGPNVTDTYGQEIVEYYFLSDKPRMTVFKSVPDSTDI